MYNSIGSKNEKNVYPLIKSKTYTYQNMTQ